MNIYIFGTATLAALLFGVYPLLLRASNLKLIPTSITMALGSFLVMTPLFVRFIRQQTRVGTESIGTSRGIALGVIAGVMAACGYLAFQSVIIRKDVEIGNAFAVIMVLQIAFAVLGARLFFNEPLTVQKIVGLIGTVVVVKLLA